MSAYDIPDEFRSLPEPNQAALHQVFAEARSLTPAQAAWISAACDAARDAVWAAAWAAARDAARDAVWVAAWDAVWVAAWAATSDAAVGCVVLDLAPDNAAILMRPWRDGLALSRWAETAPAAEVEIARALRDDWDGTGAELIDVARGCVGVVAYAPARKGIEIGWV